MDQLHAMKSKHSYLSRMQNALPTFLTSQPRTWARTSSTIKVTRHSRYALLTVFVSIPCRATPTRKLANAAIESWTSLRCILIRENFIPSLILESPGAVRWKSSPRIAARRTFSISSSLRRGTKETRKSFRFIASRYRTRSIRAFFSSCNRNCPTMMSAWRWMKPIISITSAPVLPTKKVFNRNFVALRATTRPRS